MKVFGCSKYKIDQARKMKNANVGITIPVEKEITRNRLDQKKAEHFLDFIFNSNLFQDVAYGVTKIKFDSNDVYKISRAVLIAKMSHTIAFYNEVCRSENYSPLSESSLWRKLHAVKPSQQKCLAGLGDITAAAMNGFSMLQDLSLKYKNRELSNLFERSKRYYKTNFQFNCSATYPNSISHCPIFALSDLTNKQLQQISIAPNDKICYECENLNKSLVEIKRLASNNSADEDTIYDIEIAEKDIIDYKKHLMRDCQQKKAKVFAFESLDEETGFWLKDYCQKVLPSKFREGQKEYFGKKGMSLHEDIFFTKKNNILQKKVYFTALYRCEQGLSETLSIAQLVLPKFKHDHSGVNKLFAKSDNASSYHGNFIIEALFILCKNNQIQLKRYDYNEPCRGKDQCDREAAGEKSLICSFVDAGNDLVCAEDIYTALHYGHGLKNSAVGVATIKGKSKLSGTKIAKISQYHSFEFFHNYMTMWRYYAVGDGVKQEYSNVNFDLQMFLTHPYSDTDKKTRVFKSNMKEKFREDRSLNLFHFCSEPICNGSFHTSEELEKHMMSGRHIISTLKSGMDNVKQSFIMKMQVQSNLHSYKPNSQQEVFEEECSDISKYVKGWALPTRNTFRYSMRQKDILYKLFMEGEVSGKKFSPEQVHLLIRKELQVSEYVTTQQIRSLFSCWSRLKKDNRLNEPIDVGSTNADNEEEEETADQGNNFYIYSH